MAAGLAYVEPASATVVAWATLGERLSATQIAGGVVVLAGAFLAQRGVGSGTPEEQDAQGDAESPAPILGTTVHVDALIP